jgi:hypothetical protein
MYTLLNYKLNADRKFSCFCALNNLLHRSCRILNVPEEGALQYVKLLSEFFRRQNCKRKTS